MNKILVSRRSHNGRNDECSGISEDGSIQLSLFKNTVFFEDENDNEHFVEIEEKPLRDREIIEAMEKLSRYKVYLHIQLMDNGLYIGDIVKVLDDGLLRKFQIVFAGDNILLIETTAGIKEVRMKRFTQMEYKELSLIDMVDQVL